MVRIGSLVDTRKENNMTNTIPQVGGVSADPTVKAVLTWMKTQIGKADHVVYEWHENKTFCRKYASGFMEQGGYTKDGVKVTFPQPFSGVDYVLVGTTVVGTGEVRAASELVTVRTPATFVMYYSHRDYSGHWYACGY